MAVLNESSLNRIIRSRQLSLMVLTKHSAVADLLAEDSVLLNQIFDDLLLMLVHPPSDGHDHK
jgi:hypothetical protein